MKKSPTYNFCVDYQSFTCKPTNKPLPSSLEGKLDTEILQITRRIAGLERKVTKEELISIINNGQTICPYTYSVPIGWNKPCRREEFFSGMSAIMIDVDDNVSSVEELIDILKPYNMDFSIIHKSFTWTESKPKYRGIILLKRPIASILAAKAINLFFKDLFSNIADPACTDLSRIFFGGGKNSVVYISEYICNEEILEQYYEPLLTTVKVKKKTSSYSGEYIYDVKETVPLNEMQDLFQRIPKDVRDLVVYKIQNELNGIRTYSGQYSNRYMVLFNVSRVLGQIPVLPGNLIHQWIAEAVSKNKYFKDYDKDVDYIINSGITFGKSNESYELSM